MNCNKIIYNKYCNTIVLDSEFDKNYVYVYILQLNKFDNSSINQIFIKTSSDEQIIFDINLDGFYTLSTLKVPRSPAMPYYYKDGNFYKNIEEVELLELIDVNPEYSKIDISYDYYFQTCKLKKCYVNICLKIFDQRAPINCASTNVDNNLIYLRDLLWSTLNVIDYLIEIDQFEEAQRLLERVSGCNGICESSNCGCEK